MNEKTFSIKIVSDTSREKVFAEIYYDNEEWAEISQEEETPIIAFFPPLHKKTWEFLLNEALETLQKAKERLLH